MPTITKTIGTAARDYSTVTLWEADLDNVLVYAAGDDAIGEMYNDSTFAGTTIINGGGTIGLASRKLTVPVGQRHDGTPGTGARFVMANLTTLETEIVSTLEWFAFNENGNIAYMTSEASNNIFNRILIYGGRSSIVAYGLFIGSATSVRDCEAFNIRSSSVGADEAIGIGHVGAGTPTVTILNCTVQDIRNNSGSGEATGIRVPNTSASQIKNCISMDITGSSSGTKRCFGDDPLATQDHNLSSDTTAIGTGSLVSKVSSDQFVSTVVGSEDLHLLSTADAIAAGVDLGSSPSGVEFDIDNFDRTSLDIFWDIGADQESEIDVIRCCCCCGPDSQWLTMFEG